MKLKLVTTALAIALAAGVSPVFASGGSDSDGGGRQGIGASGTSDDLLLDNVVHYGRAHQNVARMKEKMQPTPSFNSGVNFTEDYVAKTESNETGFVWVPADRM